MIQQPYPCLWFDGKAQEAAAFYCSIFPNSKINSSNQLTTHFSLNGKDFMGLNGGSHFKFNESISFVIECENQEKIDHYWNSLIAENGVEGQCGWLKDSFGVSWQVIPSNLGELLNQSTIPVFMKMNKIIVQELIDVKH